MRSQFVTLASLLLLLASARSQTRINGTGNAVIHGAKNKIDYISNIEIRNNIPDSLADYFAGLLFTNKNIRSDKPSILIALTAWMNKYHELENKILREPDAPKKSRSLRLLHQGDFTGVEDELQVKTDFRSLAALFPETYSVTGDRNVIITGDYNTVTYVVKQIVTYSLPEGVTTNLLTELKMNEDTIRSQNRQVSKLLHTIQSKEYIIQAWVTRYRSVEKDLKNSPTAVSKRAYAYFKNGYLDSAMMALTMATATVQALAGNSVLKAKILLLEINYKSYDSTLNEVNKAYSIAINISPTYDRLMEYGQFLINYPNDVNIAISVLTKAIDSAKTDIQKITVYKYLGIAYQASDKVRSTGMLEKALDMLTNIEPISDSSLLASKAIVQWSLGYNYGNALYDTVLLRNAIAITLDAIRTLDRINPLSEDIEFRKNIFKGSLGAYYMALSDTANAFKVLKEALAFFEDEHNDKISYIPAAVNVYVNLAQVNMNIVQPWAAIDYLMKAKELIRQKVNIRSNIYLQKTEQIYTMLVNNYGFLNKRDSVIKYLDEFRSMVEPLTRDSSKIYMFSYCQVITDLAAFYIDDGRLEKGAHLLQIAFNFFVSNLESVEADKDKFTKCMNFLTEYCIRNHKQDSGISLYKNNVWLIKKNESFNKLIFEEFESNVYYHISELYEDEKKIDSARQYAEKAIEISEATAKQGPIGNIFVFTFHESKYLSLLQRQGLVSEADSLSNAFITSCQYMSAFNAFIRDHYRGYIGNCAGSYASNVCDGIDSFKITDRAQILSYYKIADKCYNEALRNHLVANGERNNEYNFAYYLYARAKLEGKWAAVCDKNERDVHLANKSKYLKECYTYMNLLPPAPPLDDLKQKVKDLETSSAVVS